MDHWDGCKSNHRFFSRNLLPFESRESAEREFRPSQRGDFQIVQACRGECIRTHDVQSGHFAEAGQRRCVGVLEFRFVHRSKRCEASGYDRGRSHDDRSRKLQRPGRSKPQDHRFLEATNTCFDVAEHRLDFKKDQTVVAEIVGTTSRLMASSAISLAVNWEMGRCESSSGFSHAIATMAACCSGVNFEARPFRGWSANNDSIALFKTDRGQLHSIEINRCQSSLQRLRQTLACWGLRPTTSPTSSLCLAKASKTILARCTSRTAAVRLATISSRISSWR